MRTTRRCGGSHVVIGLPSGGAAPAGISIPVGNCQAAVSAVIAVQTSSGAAGRSTSRVISNARLMTGAPCFVIVGWSATTNRCERPPGAASSWYFATRPFTASASSTANAARSLADANRTSLSIPSVASGLPAAPRPGDELADLADHAPGDREQPARGALVGLARRIRRDRRQGGGRDHVGRGGRAEHALGAVALAALLDELHQAVALERPQVVVRLLAGQADARGERAGGSGLRELGEQAGADRVERGLGGGGVVDDGDVVHGCSVLTDNYFCQDEFHCRLSARTGQANLCSFV